ncbi:MAG: acyl-CoA dehydrogenase family protein, partial [Xanthobacteraceae bacterium]|nr:acyl-CoA dehydrogenase family protein [Xanthobacteraceae bacterium]
MVSAKGNSIRKDDPEDAIPAFYGCAKLLASEFAARAAQHDRDASFPFANFDQLSEAGLLALTVPAALGGRGAGALDASRVIGIFGKADPSTALVLS